MLQKRTQSAGGPVAECPVEFEGTQSLWDFLSQTTWPDGAPRVPGTVLLFVGEDARLKALLNDKAQDLTAFTTYTGQETIAEWLNGAIEGEATDWRRAKSTANRGRRN